MLSPMFKYARWLHVALEVVGAIALIIGVGKLGLWLVFKPFENFAGGSCSDTEEKIATQPGGSHTIKSRYTECGGGVSNAFFVELNTGNPNKGYEYTPIIEVKNLTIGTATATWDGADKLTISYPSSAKVVEAYSKIFDINVVLEPLP